MKKVLVISLVIIFIIINCIFIFNKSFYKTTYAGLFIPKYSFFIKERGCAIATFYSLKSKEDLEKEIAKNMANNYNILTMFDYRVTDAGSYRIICLEYDPFS